MPACDALCLSNVSDCTARVEGAVNSWNVYTVY